MASKDYHFITQWHVPGKVKEVTDIISDNESLVRWWPSVYLRVEELAPGDADGIGKVLSLDTKGWLPYTLHWQCRVSAIHSDGFSLTASGDFEGRGIWTFKQNGPCVDVIYDWKISAEKPLLRHFSFIMKPIFSANHHWAMARGEESLKLELARRQATTREERLQVPIPPPPTQNSPVPLALVTFVSTVVLICIGYLVTKVIAKDELFSLCDQLRRDHVYGV